MLHLELACKKMQADSINVQDNLQKLLDKVKEFDPDLIIAGGDKSKILQICQTAKEADKLVWFIALLEGSPIQECIKLLDFDVDEYFLQPLHMEELVAITVARLRRLKQKTSSSFLEYSDVKMDLISREARRNNKPIQLRAKEFDLLKTFLLNPEEVLNRQFIFDQVWGSTFLGDSNVIEVYVRYLRTKLSKPNLLKTKRGKGYILISEEAQIKKADKIKGEIYF